MDDNNISMVEYTTDTAAQALGIPPEQVRLLARKLGISAPYTAQQLDAMRLELMPSGSPAVTPTTPTAPAVDEPTGDTMITAIANAIEGDLTDALITELRPRMPRIRANVIAALVGMD
jgi:hypothetical protein